VKAKTAEGLGPSARANRWRREPSACSGAASERDQARRRRMIASRPPSGALLISSVPPIR
jgi:hypothetical protein